MIGHLYTGCDKNVLGPFQKIIRNFGEEWSLNHTVFPFHWIKLISLVIWHVTMQCLQNDLRNPLHLVVELACLSFICGSYKQHFQKSITKFGTEVYPQEDVRRSVDAHVLGPTLDIHHPSSKITHMLIQYYAQIRALCHPSRMQVMNDPKMSLLLSLHDL